MIAIAFYRKIITIGIIEEGSYEKDVTFYVNLGEPTMAPGKYLSRCV